MKSGGPLARRTPLTATQGLRRTPLASRAREPRSAPAKRARRVNHGPFRRAVMAARGEACRACGSTREVQAAHIVGSGQGGPDVVENGVPLCRPHHEDVDQYRTCFDQDWLDDDQLAWLAARGAVAWDEDGQPYGRHYRRFAPLTSAQLARREKGGQR